MGYSDWKKVNLVECLDILLDYRGKTPEKSENGILTLSAKSVKNSKIDYSEAYTISQDEYKRFMVRGIPLKGDILITTEAPMGQVAKLDRNGIAVAQRLLTLRPNSKVLNNDYLLYFLQSAKGQAELKARESGSTVTGIKQSEFRKIDIILPPLVEQKAIANVLSSLDDKIELNNKINKILEEIAQTLYKRWFVDFEFPNEGGEPYKSSGGDMVESELGLIPKGWRTVSLSELVIKCNKKVIPDGNEKIIDMANMPSYSIALCSYENGDKLSTNTYKMDKYSFLYGSIRPYLGKFGIAPFDGITTGTIHNFVVQEDYDFSFVASVTFSKNFNDFCIQLSHGTKMPKVSWADFSSYKIPYSTKVSLKFNKLVKSIYDQIVNSVLENNRLSSIRDELLPKLMNGEIEVPIKE
ncbi:MAG: restriction endonuclease subunit S [bacterium]|nr:restriction endonuclease subunit S [bacterium]